MTPFVQGLGMGGGLIVAIGAQNAFVLTQSVRKNHHLAVAALCTLCDAVLITLGVTGIGTMVASNPTFATVAALGGAAFLIWYGCLALRSAFQGGSLHARSQEKTGLRKTLMLTLAVTLLNPHAYLDTVVLLGSVSGQFIPPDRYVFGMGAVTASLLWFFALSLGGQALAPLFKRERTWRILDSLVCLTMWGIAGTLLRHIFA
ncbi:LysE family transporter [Pseudodesulfovibrio sp. JC047]|uniref:LysE/ArgO family amino acid transporter n=1 Tax=Pseudodesulfovibrio sp. JC047 TaxID=2683199 RepID=UPI0013CFDA32|nr:LysE/ArgO family amino acid transporter [Pseudodesulfovibrio sp. JC047]NDV18225.1 LysE family transporter [Pseudodesulfovibrio sp. JC047]